MNLDENDVRLLAKKFLDGVASEEEKRQLHTWYDSVNAGDTEIVLNETMQTTHAVGVEILAGLKQFIAAGSAIEKPATVRHFSRRWIAAASVVLLLGAGIFWWMHRMAMPALSDKERVPVPDIAAPASPHAVLTLQNGARIMLDSAQNGELVKQGKVQVMKLSDGSIGYEGPAAGNKEIQYNTLTVPRGSRTVQLRLADGSTVVMNAASSITYPTAFTGNERKVSITGEAYFEVAKEPSRKFLVTVNGITTEVLGTHFNVNAYADEAAIQITLLEGRVKVANSKASVILLPGQQAQLVTGQPIIVDKEADLEGVMAWKDGLFQFNHVQIGSIMRQISRWYDVEVKYEGASQKKFSGIVNRNSNVSEVLKIMEQAGLQFRITGRTITVVQ